MIQGQATTPSTKTMAAITRIKLALQDGGREFLVCHITPVNPRRGIVFLLAGEK